MKKHKSPNLQTIANREYKKRIYSLCHRVTGGDEAAEAELAAELERNSNATWAVRHWMKIRGVRLAEKNFKKRKGARTQYYRNAFKPYQGGAPGLGKRS